MDQLEVKLARLRGIFATMDSVMVAFSGGVDSSFLLKVAQETAGSRVLHRGQQCRILEEFPGCDHGIDPGYVHVNDAPRADVQVADFAVAHLSFG